MDMLTKIDGVLLTPLRIISTEGGDIYHSMKRSDPGFSEFGEAYFSTVKKDYVKAWKKHFKMTLNLTVPVGRVMFVLYDDRESSQTKGEISELIISPDNYYRLTVPPNIWLGFKGLDEDLSIILNIADLEHDPLEQINIKPFEINIPYNWTER